MNAQGREDRIATAREGRAGRGCSALLPLLMLALAACAPLPPGPNKGAQAEVGTTNAPIEPKAKLALAVVKPAISKSATSKAAPPKTAPPKVATPKVATPKAATPKAATPKAATPKAATSKAATPKPAKLAASRPSVSRKASSSAKVRSDIRSRPILVAPPETLAVTQPTPPPIEEAIVIAATQVEAQGPVELDVAPVLPPVATQESLLPPLRDDYFEEEPVFQRPNYEAPRPLQLPPIKVGVKKPSTSAKNKRRFPVKVEKVAVGDSQIEMVRLGGGSFNMGSRNGDYDERPLHEVTVSPFSMGRYEVTQRQWETVMGENPSYFNDCTECPVDSVSWNDIQQFVVKLNQLTDRQFRLPSEAEWEYACRSGQGEAYCGDSDETQVSWYLDNSGGRAQPVGLLASNAFGLYDMSGNAYEWVEDCWHGGYSGAPSDGRAWSEGDCQRRVLRGGAWYYASAYAATTYRNANMPYSRFIIYGFRLAHDERDK